MDLSSDRLALPLLRPPWPQVPLALPPERAAPMPERAALVRFEPAGQRSAAWLAMPAVGPAREDWAGARSDGAAERAADQDWALMFGAANARLHSLLWRQQHGNAAGTGGPLDHADLAEALQECLQVLEQLRQVGGERLGAARAEAARILAGARQARHQAWHDPLTELPNRAGFLARLAEVAGSGTSGAGRLALLYLDLDGFKAVNDRHGHAVGDRLLAVVALRLRRAVRAGDMMSRLGGDEFACLAQGGSSLPQLRRLALKLHAAVAAPMALDALRLSITASIGIAVCPPEGLAAAALLARADLAMYRAKRSGCGVAFHEAPG
jgi:diguanylate cyclase